MDEVSAADEVFETVLMPQIPHKCDEISSDEDDSSDEDEKSRQQARMDQTFSGAEGKEVPLFVNLTDRNCEVSEAHCDDVEQLELNPLLYDVFLDPLLAQKYICVLAVLGRMRVGKTTFLDLLARFLAHREQRHESDDWMWLNPTTACKRCPASLAHFEWRNGIEGHTQGMVLWSRPFIFGDKAIFLLDVQGAFDGESSPRWDAPITSLTLLCSSKICFKVVGSLAYDNYQYLAQFMDCARVMAADKCSSETDYSHLFQELLFVIGDFQNANQFSYGSDDGHKYLNHCTDLFKLGALTEMFRQCDCMLLPNPRINYLFSGIVADFHLEFRSVVNEWFPLQFEPEQLLQKFDAHNQPMTCRQWFTYLQQYVDVAKKGQTLSIQSVKDAQIVATLQQLVMDCVVKYMGQVTEQELAKTSGNGGVTPICDSDSDDGDAHKSSQRQQQLTRHEPTKSHLSERNRIPIRKDVSPHEFESVLETFKETLSKWHVQPSTEQIEDAQKKLIDFIKKFEEQTPENFAYRALVLYTERISKRMENLVRNNPNNYTANGIRQFVLEFCKPGQNNGDQAAIMRDVIELDQQSQRDALHAYHRYCVDAKRQQGFDAVFDKETTDLFQSRLEECHQMLEKQMKFVFNTLVSAHLREHEAERMSEKRKVLLIVGGCGLALGATSVAFTGHLMILPLLPISCLLGLGAGLSSVAIKKWNKRNEDENLRAICQGPS